MDCFFFLSNISNCVVSENIDTPHGRDFSYDHPPLQKFQFFSHTMEIFLFPVKVRNK